MTPTDIDAVARALVGNSCTDDPCGIMDERSCGCFRNVRERLIEAFNAGLEEAAKTCEGVADGTIFATLNFEFRKPDASAEHVCADAVRAKKLTREDRPA